MPTSLDIQARQTLFIVKEGASTKKMPVPKDWQFSVVATEDQLFATYLRASAAHQRILVVVSEEDFNPVLSMLRRRVPKEKSSSVYIVVVAKDPRNFYNEQHIVPELLDVVPEKEFRRLTEFYLQSSIRDILRLEIRSISKAGLDALQKLNEIFIELAAERNPQRLLAAILENAIKVTQASSGSLYLIEETDGDMNFKVRISHDGAKGVDSQSAPHKVLENSICGYVVLTGKLLNISNIADLRPLTLPQFNRNMDHIGEPETVSLLSFPLKNSRHDIIGVLELANKRIEGSGDTVVFDSDDERILASFATQAATCMENVELYGDIQNLFEGFIRASITAIESRDPSTAGHSERVAKLCVELARATSECQTGIYRSVKFKEEEIRELEYAAMLHDFGKIGVREEVLVKAKKLYPYQLESIKERIKICKAAARINSLETRLKNAGGNENWEAQYKAKVAEIDKYWEIIQTANEPNVLKKEKAEALDRLRTEQLLLPDGNSIHVLTEEEYQALAVAQGSLTPSERLEIESHVRHTYQFLKMIPWTRDFKHLTEVAYCHHEKLDGTGYPRGLTAHEIPLQSKIMTIADIYDALTAADRWYKEAVPVEKAIEILGIEVSQGKLDPILYELFVERKVFLVTQPKKAA